MFSVLYVDDEPGLLEIAKIFLEQTGIFRIDTALSATEAIHKMEVTEYDGIISDYQMPEMDGIAFLKHMRRSNNPTPFILFTGRGREEVVIEALNSGADYYLQKGGDIKSQFAELSHKTRLAIERRRTENELIESEKRYRAVVEDQTELIARFLPDGTHIFVNEAYGKYFGKSSDEIIGTRFKPDISEDDARRVRGHLDNLTPDHPYDTIEHRVTLPGGEQRWQHWSDRAFFGARGELIGFQSVGRDVTERKQAEEALEKRIIALTKPLESSDISFTDLFNIEDIQKIQDAFCEATSVASLITLPDGSPITQPSNFSHLCSDIIRSTQKGVHNCQISDATIGKPNPDGPIIRPCLSVGLCNAGASIILGGKHIANWLIGQVRDEYMDEENLLRYAREIGADEEEFRKALQEIPSMKREQFEKIARFLFLLANVLSEKAYQNVQQARFITDRRKAEEELRAAYEQIAAVEEELRSQYNELRMLEDHSRQDDPKENHDL